MIVRRKDSKLSSTAVRKPTDAASAEGPPVELRSDKAKKRIAKATKKKANESPPMLAFAYRTDRFDVYRLAFPIDERVSFASDYYCAFPVETLNPRPIFHMLVLKTPSINYAGYIQTSESARRNGIATEVVRGFEHHIGQLMLEGKTREGKAFCRQYLRKFR